MMMDDYDVHLYYFDLIIEILMYYQKVLVVVVFEVDQDQKKPVDLGNHLIHRQEFFLLVIFEHH
jgi:hypothetical protein